MKEEVCIITGSGAGIGRATAHQFAALGYRLVLVARTLDHLHTTKEQCLQKNAELTDKDVLCVRADVGEEADLQNVVSQTVAQFGRIDVLVNNAGHFYLDTMETFNAEYFDSMMRVHVRGVGIFIRLALPHLIQSKGCIINVSSDSALRPFNGCVSYCAVKAAQDHLTRCCAIELGPKGVRVNAVNPGYVATDVMVNNGLDISVANYYAEVAQAKSPLRRVCQPDEIASAIVFLASPGASYVHGVCLPMEGGHSLTVDS